jgi:hypothetical protein
MRIAGQPELEETENPMRVSGNFPRRYYPDRVQRDSLSLAARFSTFSNPETRAEAPLFRQQSLKHKNETTRKQAALILATRTGKKAAFLPFRSSPAHSGTMPRTPMHVAIARIQRELRSS